MQYRDVESDGMSNYLWLLLGEWSKTVNSHELSRLMGLVRIEDDALTGCAVMFAREEIAYLKAELASA